jgi:hypothetical protein
VFRRSVENQCIIDLIDKNRNHASVVQGGRMNITSHESVLALLENQTPVIASMLSTIQRMRFFLCTGYGDSEGYARGDQDDVEDPIRTQGMCQGNTALPAAWSVTSIPMIKAHRRKEHGAHFIAPISGLSCHFIRGLFVDNTNLFHLDMRRTETALEAHTCLQESVINWGKLLLATGGALKLAK